MLARARPNSARTWTATANAALPHQRAPMPNNQILDLGDVSQVGQLILVQPVFYDIARDLNIQPDELVKNLCSVDYQGKFDAVRGIAHPSAGQWLLKKEEYIKWKEGSSKSRLLWLRGVPGSGKTVLSSIVIADIERDKDLQFPVIFCFCDRTDDNKRNPVNLLRSLLGQLLQRVSQKSEAEIDLRRQNMNVLFDYYSEFAGRIIQISREIGRTFVIIDGVDECDRLQHFLPVLQKLATELHIFVTSRDHRDIRQHLGGHIELIIRADDIAHDVQQFVRSEAERITERIGVHDPNLVNSIVHKLTSGAQGTFLWPASHIEQLGESDTLADIEKSLCALPPKFSDTIAWALKAISGRLFQRPYFVLKLVLCATRPLTLPELAEGVATAEMSGKWDPSRMVLDPMLLIDSCANLLICVPPVEGDQLEIVAPFHDFVEKFMLVDSKHISEWKQGYTLHRSSVHTELARVCLSYLKLKALKHYRSVLSEISHHPFAAYAVAGWLEHIRASRTDVLAKEFQQFLAPESTTFEIWRRLFVKWSGSFTSSKVLDHLEYLDPAHLAVWFNLPMIIPYFSDAQLSAEDYRGLSALHVAMEISSPISVIDHLLDKVGVDQPSKEGKTALHIAITQFKSRGKAVIQRLWEAGAEMDATDQEGRTALHLAMLNPGRALACIVPLLKNHADPNARDYSLLTPLHIAASAPEYVLSRKSPDSGHRVSTAEDYIRAMNILLVHRADVWARDGVGNTPLHLAADNVNAFAVEFLLNQGAFANAVNEEGCTPLHLAIRHSLLPENRWNVFATPEQRDQESTVAILLRHAADVNVPINGGIRSSPLHLAALSCCKEIIFDLLIGSGAAVDSTDAEGNSPLQVAARAAPIINPTDSVGQWRISWSSLREIVTKLITDESDRASSRRIAERVLRLINLEYPDVVAGLVVNLFVDLEPEHPFTTWFEKVKQLLCSNGARMDRKDINGRDIVSSTTEFWASWIHHHHKSIAARQTASGLLALHTEWARISNWLSHYRSEAEKTKENKEWTTMMMKMMKLMNSKRASNRQDGAHQAQVRPNL